MRNVGVIVNMSLATSKNKKPLLGFSCHMQDVGRLKWHKGVFNILSAPVVHQLLCMHVDVERYAMVHICIISSPCMN